MMGPGVGTYSNGGPPVRVYDTGFRSRGGARCDRLLADLALGLRALDLPSFTREVVRCARDGLGVEHCEVSRFLARGRPGFGWTGHAREDGPLGGISVVVRANGCAFGVLSAYSAPARRYTKEEASFLQDVAGLLGVAVERALSAEVHRRALAKERRRAEAAEERYDFLHEANAVLAAAPDGHAALAAAAHLAVPALADFCFVDLVQEDGASRALVRRLVVARSGRAGDSVEFALCYPLDTSASHGTPKVLRTGQPESIPDLPDALLRSLAGGREHLELMRDLAPGSYLCVPLQAGLRLIGSIGFVSSRSGRGGRRYGPEDLGLARCLARCTALVAASWRPPAQAPGKVTTRLWDTVVDAQPVLTSRQLEVLRLLDGGLRVHQIKVELGISEPTVRTHVRAILRALGACSQLEALHKARVFGLVDGSTATDRSP